MSAIDVRNEAVGVVDTIIFADRHDSFVSATHLTHMVEGILLIYDEEDDYVCITSVEHGENLIKAVRKAIELNWLKK